MLTLGAAYLLIFAFRRPAAFTFLFWSGLASSVTFLILELLGLARSPWPPWVTMLLVIGGARWMWTIRRDYAEYLKVQSTAGASNSVT